MNIEDLTHTIYVTKFHLIFYALIVYGNSKNGRRKKIIHKIVN